MVYILMKTKLTYQQQICKIYRVDQKNIKSEFSLFYCFYKLYCAGPHLTSSSPAKMFFSLARWRDSLVKNILGGEEKVRVANLFFSKQNVRLGRLPIGVKVRKFWKILGGLWQRHTFWLVPTLFGRFYMPNKIGYVSYLRKSPFGPLSGPKWPTSGFFGDFFGFSFIK